MGCCDSRDDKKVIKIPKVKIRTVTKYINITVMQNQDLVVLPERQMANESEKSDIEGVLYYIQWCRHKKKWKELSIFIWDSTPVSHINTKNSFSLSPNTLSSLVLIYFKQALLEKCPEAKKICENLIPDLIKLLFLNDSDFMINLFLLLDTLLNENNEKISKILIGFSFFEITKKFISDKSLLMCKLVITVSMKIYTGKKYAQDLFVRCGSAKKLTKALRRCGKHISELFLVILESLWALLELPGELINHEVQSHLIEQNLSEILISIPPPMDPCPYSLLLYHLFPPPPPSSSSYTSLI